MSKSKVVQSQANSVDIVAMLSNPDILAQAVSSLDTQIANCSAEMARLNELRARLSPAPAKRSRKSAVKGGLTREEQVAKILAGGKTLEVGAIFEAAKEAGTPFSSRPVLSHFLRALKLKGKVEFLPSGPKRGKWKWVAKK